MNKWIVLMLGLVMSATIYAADCQWEGAAVESVLVKVRRDGSTPLSAAKVLMPNLSTDGYSAVATLAEVYKTVPSDMIFPVFVSACQSYLRNKGVISGQVIKAVLSKDILQKARDLCETKEGQKLAYDQSAKGKVSDFGSDTKRQCYGVFYEVLLDGMAEGLREGGVK